MTLNELNAQYNDETYPLLPFISKHNLTPIPKGLYRKPNAKFRGVTAKLDPETNTYVVMMHGMFDVKEDIIIVPENATMSVMKQVLLDTYIEAGYKEVPKFQCYEQKTFPLNSEEGKLALANLTMFKTKSTHNEVPNN